MIKQNVYSYPDPNEGGKPELVAVVKVTDEGELILRDINGAVIYQASLERWAWQQMTAFRWGALT